jgi:hypothetical protein
VCAPPAWMTWIHLVSPYCSATGLLFPQHGLFKDLPSFVTPRPGDQGHMHARLKYFPSVHRPRAILFALNFCAPPGSTWTPWHYCLASALMLFPCFLC